MARALSLSLSLYLCRSLTKWHWSFLGFFLPLGSSSHRLEFLRVLPVSRTIRRSERCREGKGKGKGRMTLSNKPKGTILDSVLLTQQSRCSHHHQSIERDLFLHLTSVNPISDSRPRLLQRLTTEVGGLLDDGSHIDSLIPPCWFRDCLVSASL